MRVEEIDFSPLQQIKSVGRYVLIGTRNNRVTLAVFLVLVIISVAVTRQIILGAFIGVGYVYWLTTVIIGIKRVAWRDFAAKNNFPIRPADMMLLPPAVANLGHNKAMSEIITVPLGMVTCELFAYKYVVGYGKSATTYNLTVARIELAKQLPHIVLDSHINDPALTQRVSGLRHLQLEGDFNKHFSLYIAKGEHIDVLSIITPDVMQVLIDSVGQQDIEIAGNSLYFASAHEAREPVPLRSLLESVISLSAEINHRVRTLQYTPRT